MNPVIRRCGVAALPLLSAVGFTVMLNNTAWAQTANIQPVVCLAPNGTTSSTATGGCFTDPAGLADTAEPGSVLVFPKVSEGSVVVDAGIPLATFTAPKTEIEIGAVCPVGTVLPGQTSSLLCPLNMPIRIHLHWVCEVGGISYSGPAILSASNSICASSDAYITMTVNGKIRFNPSNIPMDGGYPVGDAPQYGVQGPVPTFGCITGRGYLVAVVVNEVGQPVKWDGLIGDVVQRNTSLANATSTQDLQTYAALAIQADPRLTNFVYPSTSTIPAQVTANLTTLITTIDGNTVGNPTRQNLFGLAFDGAPGHYQMVTGQFMADVRYDQDDVSPFADTFIVMLTLDALAGAANPVTSYSANFYSENQFPLSVANIQFICWRQVQLTSLSATLSTTNMSLASGARSPKGLVVTNQATQPFGGASGNGTLNPGGRSTLLALIQTTEGPAGGSANFTRSYTARPYNNSVPIPTTFWVPFP